MVSKTRVRVQALASCRFDGIYRTTRDRWGEQQADQYIIGLFEAFGGIETHGTLSWPIPAGFGVDGCYFRHGRYFVYWRRLANGGIGIVSILHERMHQIDCFREDAGG